jgi:PAS domain S-box-containing protein
MGKENDFPQLILAKWQKLIDLLSFTFDLPATLIMQVNKDSMEVFAKCFTEGNPYSVGESEKMAGLYCETVIKSESKLLVSNALLDPAWDDNPDIKLGMIAYFGFPLKYPNGDVFGTICVLDDKENTFNKTIEDFLLQVKDIIELDLIAYSSYENTSQQLEEEIIGKFISENSQGKSVLDLERELNQQKHIHKILQAKLKHFDSELLRMDSKYETLFASMNSAMVIFERVCDENGDLYDARYLNMNAKNEEIISFKKEEIIGKTVLDIFPETEPLWFENFDSVFKKNQAINFDLYHKSLEKHLSVNAFKIEENIFGLSFHDITEYVTVKQKLKESEKRYKTIFNESSSIMLLLSPKNGEIIEANASAVEFYGFEEDELVGMKMSDINVMSREELQQEIDLATNKKKNHFQFKHQLASGEIRDIEVYSGSILSDGEKLLHSVIHDVTDRRIAQEKVNRLSMAVEQSPVAIVITDAAGRILYTNPKHCELTGYSNDEMIGQNPRVLKSGKFSSDVYISIWKTISSGNKWNGEFFNKKKDGSFYWELASIAPIKDEKGEIVNYIKIGEDITERKRLENQLNQSMLKAEESDRLKSSFLSNLSHEVRTPMNGMIGFTNLMMSDDITAEERKEYGAFVESSGNQLMTMMDGILKISMIEAGQLNVKYSKFRMSDLFLEIERYYSNELSIKGLKSKFHCDCNSFIRNDKKRIRQILDNLIHNAIKFTKTGSVIVNAECTSEMLILSVEDTGIGIDCEHHEKIFERFSQIDNLTTRKFEGTGLGLAISKEIVTLLGGDIWLESQLGKGAKFIFTIPSVSDEDKICSDK